MAGGSEGQESGHVRPRLSKVSPRTAMLVWIGSAFASWTAVWFLATAIAGCAAAPTPPTGLPAALLAPSSTIEQALAPPPLAGFGALLAPSEKVEGRVRPIFGKTGCEATIPLPYIVPQVRAPRVGELWRCLFVSTVSATPPPPDWPMWLIVSARPPGADLPRPMGDVMPGCWQLVHTDFVIPVPPPTRPPLETDMIVRTRGAGRFEVRWKPAPGMAGMMLWMQLLVAAPGRSPSGLLSSHAIEIIVGS